MACLLFASLPRRGLLRCASLRARVFTTASAAASPQLTLLSALPLATLSRAGLEQVAIAASNTWGLLMVVVMLGYGVVDVPRQLWRATNKQKTLRQKQFRCAAIHAELTEAASKVRRLLYVSASAAGRGARPGRCSLPLNLPPLPSTSSTRRTPMRETRLVRCPPAALSSPLSTRWAPWAASDAPPAGRVLFAMIPPPPPAACPAVSAAACCSCLAPLQIMARVPSDLAAGSYSDFQRNSDMDLLTRRSLAKLNARIIRLQAAVNRCECLLEQRVREVSGGGCRCWRGQPARWL